MPPRAKPPPQPSWPKDIPGPYSGPDPSDPKGSPIPTLKELKDDVLKLREELRVAAKERTEAATDRVRLLPPGKLYFTSLIYLALNLCPRLTV